MRSLLLVLLLSVSVGEVSAQSLYERFVEGLVGSRAAVCVEGEPCETAEVASQISATAFAGGARDAMMVYTTGCAVCHDAGIGGAPRLGDLGDWSSRRRPVLDLAQSVIRGLGSMPPKGLCQDCTDEELLSAVQYMEDALAN